MRGHYAIARWNPQGYREVWNLRRHFWASASDEVLTLDEAQALLRDLRIPTAPFAPRPSDDALWDQTLKERDNYCWWADQLADAIAKHFNAEIGEHSNVNNPWKRALEAIDAAMSSAAPMRGGISPDAAQDSDSVHPAAAAGDRGRA